MPLYVVFIFCNLLNNFQNNTAKEDEERRGPID